MADDDVRLDAMPCGCRECLTETLTDDEVRGLRRRMAEHATVERAVDTTPIEVR